VKTKGITNVIQGQAGSFPPDLASLRRSCFLVGTTVWTHRYHSENRGIEIARITGIGGVFFKSRSEWFRPSDSSFMINYRIDDLDEMIAQLRADGVEVVGGPESHENGKFAWILDPDGNKVELWEPMIWDERN
jgi:predicted enzyme related to lactoylglutathione lyase